MDQESDYFIQLEKINRLQISDRKLSFHYEKENQLSKYLQAIDEINYRSFILFFSMIILLSLSILCKLLDKDGRGRDKNEAILVIDL